MIVSSSRLRSWIAPLLQLSPEEDWQVACVLVSLNQVFVDEPRVVRALSDRSIPMDQRLKWLGEAFELPAKGAIKEAIRVLIEDRGFSQWNRFFREYLMLRQAVGKGQILLVKSVIPLESEALTHLQQVLATRLQTPVRLYPVIDQSIGGGFRVESFDGWIYDASVEGRLHRLETALVA